MQNYKAALVLAGAAAVAGAFYWVAGQAAGCSGQQKRNYTSDEEEVPDEFKDPITYEIITEPVVLCATGQVYEYQVRPAAATEAASAAASSAAGASQEQLQSLRQWLTAGNYRCPRTNLDLVDAQVCRLPWLKQSIRDWLQQHGKQLPAEANCSLADIEATQPEIAAAIRSMRNDSGSERLTATTLLAYQYRRWQDSTVDDAAAQMAQAEVRSAVLDDLLWIIRYAAGEPQLQGAAASLLACCCLDEEMAWLAATAVVPLVAMLNCGHSYAQEWALQVVYKICLHVHSSRPLLWKAGAVQAMLQLISQEQAAVGFHRDRAAVALATLAEAAEVKAWLREHGVLALVRLLLTSSDRWEQRDAAFALMALQLDSQQLQAAAAHVLAAANGAASECQPGTSAAADSESQSNKPMTAAPGPTTLPYNNGVKSSQSSSSSSSSISLAAVQSNLSHAPSAAAPAAVGAATLPLAALVTSGVEAMHALLGKYRWCSQQYLQGQVDQPDAGITNEELAARLGYEEALDRYRQALAERQQQQHAGGAAVQAAVQGVFGNEVQHPRQLLVWEAQPWLEQEQQQHMEPQRQIQQLQQQQREELVQHQQRQPTAHEVGVVVPHVEDAAAATEQQEQQVRQRRRHRHGQQPRHWMAEHDADGASPAAASGLMDGAASSSSSSDESEGETTSDEVDDPDSLASRDDVLPARLLGLR